MAKRTRTPSLTIAKQTSGFMGESLTAFLLEQHFKAQGLTILNVGDQGVPFDLLVLDPKAGMPFRRATAISVKTREQSVTYIDPSKRIFQESKDRLEKMGIDLWIAYVKCRYKDKHLSFKVFLVPSDKIDGKDFSKVRFDGKDVELLLAKNLEAKSEVTISSKKRRNEKSLSDTEEEAERQEEDGAFPRPEDLKVNEMTIGRMGEDMVRFLLETEYKDAGLEVGNVARSMWPYDLIIEEPRERTIFRKRAAISVKTRRVSAGTIPPSWERLQEDKKKVEATGMELWMAFLQYRFKDGIIDFGVFLTRARDLKKRDFVDIRRWGGDDTAIRVMDLRKKAELKIWSGKI